MGLFDQIAGALSQQLGGSAQANQLTQLVTNLINSHPGGLQGLVQQFTQAGLAQQVQSWVSTGKKLADQRGSDHAGPWLRQGAGDR